MPDGKGRNGGGQEPQISPRTQQGRGNNGDNQYYDYDADGGSYASPQSSPYQTENGIDPSKKHEEEVEEHVHMPGRGRPPGFDLHLNLNPLTRTNTQNNGTDAADAGADAGAGTNFNPNLDTSNMDAETRAYYEYLQASRAHSTGQIRLAEAEIADANGMSDVCDSPSPGPVRRVGADGDADRDGDGGEYCTDDSTEISPDNSLDQRRRERATARQRHRSAFTSESAEEGETERRYAGEEEEDDAGEFVGVGAAADAALRALRTAAVEAEDEAMYAEQKAATIATAAALKMFAEAKAAQAAAGAGAGGARTGATSLGFSQEIEVEEGDREGEVGHHIAFINVETKGHISDID